VECGTDFRSSSSYDAQEKETKEPENAEALESAPEVTREEVTQTATV